MIDPIALQGDVEELKKQVNSLAKMLTGVGYIIGKGGRLELDASIVASSLLRSSHGHTISNTPTYANNAAAVAAGLSRGSLYRTGADPDVICMVH